MPLTIVGVLDASTTFPTRDVAAWVQLHPQALDQRALLRPDEAHRQQDELALDGRQVMRLSRPAKEAPVAPPSASATANRSPAACGPQSPDRPAG